MEYKRITIFAGHYGSGKTNIAVNYAKWLRQYQPKVAIADLDIVNPYYRTKDSMEDLQRHQIRVIASDFAGSNVDLPALPQAIYSVCDDHQLYSVLDVGGDDRGAYALGRYVPQIKQENNYEMIFVANCYRPLTQTPEKAMEVMREIEKACGLLFTHIVNNSNIAQETTSEIVLNSTQYIEELSKISGLPIKFTAIEQSLQRDIDNNIQNMFLLKLQDKVF